MKTGEFKIEVEFRSSLSISENMEDDYIRKSVGAIVARGHDEQMEFDIPIGKITLSYYNLQLRHKNKDDLFYCLDLLQDSVDYCMPLMDVKNNCFRRKLRNMFSDHFIGENVLSIDIFEILPRHRGKRIGLAVLKKTIEALSNGCAVVVIRPLPLQFAPQRRSAVIDDNYEVGSFTANRKLARNKLVKYYSLLGFAPFSNSDLMVLNPNIPLPSLSQLGCVEDGYYEIEYQIESAPRD